MSLSVAILTLRAVPCPRTPSHMSRIDASVTPKSEGECVCENWIRVEYVLSANSIQHSV